MMIDFNEIKEMTIRIPILFKDCPLGVSERRHSRNEHSDSISEQICRSDCAYRKPQKH